MCAKQNRSMACSRDKFQPTRKFKKLSSPQPIPDLQAGKIAQNYEHMTSHVPRLTHTHIHLYRGAICKGTKCHRYSIHQSDASQVHLC